MTLSALVVDDNPAARDILTEALAGVVARVDAVSGGAEAVAAVKQHDEKNPTTWSSWTGGCPAWTGSRPPA